MPKLSKHDAWVLELVHGSSLTVSGKVESTGSLRSLKITIDGDLSKLPSTTNKREIGMVKRKGSKTGAMRPILMKNPEQAARTEALSRLLEAKEVGSFDDLSRRVFVLILLGSSCYRMDSHNIPKFVCDWLQSMGIYSNDKNVDALCFHKAQFGVKESSTCVHLSNDASIRAILTNLVFTLTADENYREAAC